VAVDPRTPWRQQRDRLLAEAHTPRQRVETLARLEGHLRQEAQTLARAADAKPLAALAQFYGELVGENLLAEARALPRAERRAVLQQIADQLTQTESALQRLLADKVQEAAAEPLRDIALAARQGNEQIVALIQSEAV
jgi:hypothetical protein